MVGVAAPYLYMTLGFRLGHGGTFDYQRRGNHLTGFVHLPQFREVSNMNVGLFAQQAGMTLDQSLEAAGLLAKYFSNNYHPENLHGLDTVTAQYIMEGYNIGKTGVYGPAATP